MAQILLVDDDDILRSSFEGLLQDEGYDVVSAASGSAALEVFPDISPHCVVMDVRLPGMDGLSVLKALREDPDCPPVVIMTAYGTTDTAIEAMKLGAFDYILKPFEIPRILELVARAVEAGERQRSRDGGAPVHEGKDMTSLELVGSSKPMQEVYKAIGRVAPTDALVLLRGESGTGKEVVARSIWKYSPRSKRPIAVVNCVAIPDTLLESELFGYERGAFTGASQSKPGRIEQAAGGTVFLDEIGDMPLSVQAKLLRLLQERQVERIGAPNPVPVDVRIIAATNVDLERSVAEGRFREDLYYRLKVVTLWLPPLRNRLEDIPELTHALLARQAARIGVVNPGIEQDALDYLGHLPWPGNVRELANLLQKVLVFSDGSPICRGDVLRVHESDSLGQDRWGDGGSGSSSGSPVPAGKGASPEGIPSRTTAPAQVEMSPASSGLEAQGSGRSVSLAGDVDDADLLGRLIDAVLSAAASSGDGNAFDTCMDLMGRAVVRRALELSDGNRSRAARLLGLSRPTLLARMEKYGLKVETRIS